MSSHARGALLAACLLALAAAACAELGPRFQPVPRIPPGMALIYFYRPDTVEGAAIVYNVRSGDRVLNELQPGSYFPHIVRPGVHRFWARSESRSLLSLAVEAGRTYYVRGSTREGTFIARPQLELVSEAEGRSEIAACRLVPPRQ